MSSKAFTEGTEHGGLTTDFEIKILICCMVNHISENITQQELTKILLETELVNYFELASAISELLSAKHISLDENNCLQLGELGLRTASEFEKSLPKSVRVKCYKSADRFLHYRRIENEIDINYSKVDDGWEFSLEIKDQTSSLFSCKMFIPTEKDCRQLKERIYNSPTHIYKGLLAVLMGSKYEMTDYLNEEENLHTGE